MQKILIIGPAHPLRGGLATFNERMAQELLSLGYDVTIHTFSLQYPSFLFPGKTQLNNAPAPELEIFVTINSINPLNWIKIGKKLRDQHFDIVICRFWLPFMAPCLGTILRIIRGNKHSRIIGLIDNIIPHEKRLGDRPLAQYFCDACDAFTVMSHSVETELKAFSKNKPIHYQAHPIYDNYGVPVEKKDAQKHLNLKEGEKYLLFFGFIRDYKGLDILLHAMSDERIRKANIKLIIAGEFYGNKDTYLNIIKSQNIENQVVLKTDYIPDNQVRYYFCAVDVIVQPYKSATQSGISQIAYHFDKPMIVSDVGGLPEIVPHGKAGLVVKPNSEQIAQAIVDFYSHDNDFEKGIEEVKQRFSWQVFVEEMIA